MNVLRVDPARRLPLLARIALTAAFLGLPIAVQPSTGSEVWSPSAAVQPVIAQPVIADVASGPDGVLHGRITDASRASRTVAPSGWNVTLLKDRSAVAVTRTDRYGRFAMRNLPDGLYLLRIEGPDFSAAWPYRVWSTRTAPPQAMGRMNVPLDSPVIRGRGPSPFPFTSLRHTATVSGIAVGALAAPVIYHNATVDNRLPVAKKPASP